MYIVNMNVMVGAVLLFNISFYFFISLLKCFQKFLKNWPVNYHMLIFKSALYVYIQILFFK